MALRFARSVARHGISRERVRQVVETCRSPLYSDDDDRAGLVLYLGLDGLGVPLEIVGVEMADGDLLIIHAMRLRASKPGRLRTGDEMARTVITKDSRKLTESDIERLATGLERDLDLTSWKPRPGRPSLGDAPGVHSPRIAVRVPEDLHRRAVARAASEGRSISAVVRDLLERYAGDAGRA